MKLRTTKKQKSNDYDIGCDSAPDQTHKKSSTMKTQTEKDGLSSNEVIFIYLYIFRIQICQMKMKAKTDINLGTQYIFHI